MTRDDGRVEVARLGQAIGFRIVGPGSVRQSLALQRASADVLSKGVQKILLDLSLCTSMDSTLLGCILKMYTDFGSVDGELVLTLVNPSPAVCRTLQSTGVDRLFPVQGESSLDGDWQPLSIPHWDDEDVGLHVLKSHQTLAELDEQNRRVFGPIVEQLRRELDSGSE